MPARKKTAATIQPLYVQVLWMRAIHTHRTLMWLCRCLCVKRSRCCCRCGFLMNENHVHKNYPRKSIFRSVFPELQHWFKIKMAASAVVRPSFSTLSFYAFSTYTIYMDECGTENKTINISLVRRVRCTLCNRSMYIFILVVVYK